MITSCRAFFPSLFVYLLLLSSGVKACDEDVSYLIYPTHQHIVATCADQNAARQACEEMAASRNYSAGNCRVGGRWTPTFTWELVYTGWLWYDYNNIKTPFMLGYYYYNVPVYAKNEKNAGPPRCKGGCFGDPINAGTGNKFESVTLYAGQGIFPLELELTYNSLVLPDYNENDIYVFGRHRTSTYSRRVTSSAVTSMPTAYLARADGKTLRFIFGPSGWSADRDVVGKLVNVTLVDGTTGWQYNDESGEVELYDATGRLISIFDQFGNKQSLTYNGVGRIESVTDPLGRSILFLYGSDNRVSKIKLPDGNAIDLLYSPSGDLSQLTYQDGSIKKYFYDESGLSQASASGLLTGEVDELNSRYSSTSYDSTGHAWRTVLSGNAETYSATYVQHPTGGNYMTRSTISTPSGAVRTVDFIEVNGVVLPASIVSTCTSCQAEVRSYTYDINGRVDTANVSGIVADYDYDANGFLVKKVEATNDPSFSRTVQTDWHATFRSALQRRVYDAGSTLVSKTDWTYNDRGQQLTEVVTDPSGAGEVRSQTRTYCEQADVDTNQCPIIGLLKSTNGPRTDVSDLTTYTYYPTDDATCASAPTTCPHRKGDLQTITNAAGQVAQYLRYDGAGRLLESVDPNGVHTTLTYHPRGWLTSRTVGGLTTSITYDAVGQVIKTTQPDGSFVAYSYDAAHRLTGIADNLGNRIDYTLDAAGNRTAEATKDAAGVLKRSLTRVYDQLGRLSQSIDALGAITQQTYDANGNADLGTDALGRSTDQDVDPLNRLKKSLRDVGGVAANTAYAYDAQDNLTEVTDPNGLKTHYTYNGLNDLLQLSSPDTGTTAYTYDAAGNRLSQTDARGVATNYSYDALNRLTDIAYPDAALNVHFSYDVAASACAVGEQAAVGRLSGFTDASGNTALCYDPLGRLTRKQQTTTGVALTTTYAYAANGRLSQMTTPGGMIVSYGYDSAGRISGIDTQLPGEPSASAVIDAVRYLPFGPIDQITYGNGRIQTRSYDANYAIDQVSSTGANGLSLDFAVDAVGNLTQVTSGAAGNLLAYDGVDRLTEVKQLNNDLIEAFAYDATGNRTAHTDSAGITPYSYTAGSHRLSAVGATTRSVDAAGNTTAIGGTAFSYDDRNRMSAATVAGQSTQYQYNARGERVSKAGTVSTIFVYDEAGHLLGEYASDGSVRAEYVWLGDLPVAVRNADDTLAYMEPDHLGTPRAVIDPVRDVAIWQWPLLGNAFGDAAPVTDPDGDGVVFTMNLRFPGQYFDAETGLHYNYFRDYEPSTGRYVESDPAGLGGGVSTFGYANENPHRFVDPLGLWVKLCVRWLKNVDFLASGATSRTNPLAHFYLDISGYTVGFGPGSGNVIFGPGAYEFNENPSADNCSMVCDDPKFDQYVKQAIEEVGLPRYSIAISMQICGAMHCRKWAVEVLRRAKEKYNENEQCPRCSK